MKIGILTFHCAHNYGAVLQCYGLQEYLKSLGHNVYVIDYRPKYLTRHRDYLKFKPRLLVTKSIKLLPKIFWTQLSLAKYRNKRWKKFNNFISKSLNLYPINDGFDGRGFDVCIVGSDQVWNSHVTGHQFEPLYFGVGFKCPVISYAASTIVDDYSEQDKKILSKLLINFSALSVREEKLQRQLNEFSNLKPIVVVDPTILAGSDAFLSLTHSIRKEVRKGYVLTYTIHEDTTLHTFAKKIAEEKNLQVIEISSTYSLTRKKTKLYDVSISEFVTLFKNADFIVTNSFHGTAFSLIFRKSFYAIKQNNAVDDRIDSILRQINLSDRFIQSDFNNPITEINYSNIEKTLLKYRQESILFLNNELNSITQSDKNENHSNNLPEISVIMPVYNAELYLRESIDSVLSQSFSNFELIIVDDGSQDGCYQICDEYKRKDPRVIVHHKVNEGVSIARNYGINLAKGKYIIFLDSDDMLYPDTLNNLYSEIIRNPYLTFVQGAHKILDGKGLIKESRIDSIRKKYDRVVLDNNDYVSKVLLNHMFSVNILYKKDFIQNNNIYYPEGLCYLEDAYFLINFFSYHPIGSYISDATYLYRSDVPNSATGSPINDKKIMSQVESAGMIKNRVDCFSDSGYIVVKNYVHELAWGALKLCASRAKQPNVILKRIIQIFPKIKCNSSLLSIINSFTYSFISPKISFHILKKLGLVRKHLLK